MPQALLGMELAEIQALLGPEYPGYRARQVYDALYRRRTGEPSKASDLPLPLRESLKQGWSTGFPGAEKIFVSSDGTKRYLLRLDDGRTVEAVLMPEGERNTMCISTQVGCPVNCKFCMTALMGFERNLTAGEIVGQILFVAGDNDLWAGANRINIVMMGMGEPLLNLENVLKATRLASDPRGVGIPVRRITLSTSGIIPKIEEMGRADVRPKLAISLNASTEEQRRLLMPITRKYTLKDLMEACRAYPLRPWENLTFEYVLLKDVNDTNADARRVVRMLAQLRCRVNLIALNPGPGIDFSTPDPERVASFQAIVRRSIPCFIRKPRGRDIFAACGQLKRISLAQAS